jgi:hypothetical protein
VKVGFGIQKTISTIAAAFEMPDLSTALCSHSGLFLDLGQLAKVKGAVQDPSIPLHDLVQAVLKRQLLPPESPNNNASESATMQMSNWINTTAVEIESVWQVYLSLSQHRSVGLQLSPSEIQIGQLVTMVAACKEVAEGIVLDHNGSIDVIMDGTGTQTTLKITPAYSLIQINRVLVPGSLVSKHKQTIQWISDHGGKAVVQTRTLRTRAAIPPVPIDPQSTSILGIPALPTSPAESETIVDIGPSQDLLQRSDNGDLETEDESDIEDTGEGSDVDDDTVSTTLHIRVVTNFRITADFDARWKQGLTKMTLNQIHLHQKSSSLTHCGLRGIFSLKQVLTMQQAQTLPHVF